VTGINRLGNGAVQRFNHHLDSIACAKVSDAALFLIWSMIMLRKQLSNPVAFDHISVLAILPYKQLRNA